MEKQVPLCRLQFLIFTGIIYEIINFGIQNYSHVTIASLRSNYLKMACIIKLFFVFY